MPFHPIVVNTKTFNQAGLGRYMLSTVQFGDPLDYFKVTGGARNAKTGLTSAAISRVIEKDVVEDGRTSRRSMSVQVVVQLSNGFTVADADLALSDINEFVEAANLNRLLSGEQ